MSFFKRFFGPRSRPSPSQAPKATPTPPPTKPVPATPYSPPPPSERTIFHDLYEQGLKAQEKQPKPVPAKPASPPTSPGSSGNEDLNAKDSSGTTVLMRAARAADRGYREVMVMTAIRLGEDVNVKNNDGSTALMIAATVGNLDTVKSLIAAGADVNAKNNDGTTALLGAVLNTHTGCVKELIAAGADVNAVPVNYEELIAAGGHVNAVALNYGRTPLMWAAFTGDSDCVKALIAAGADVNAKKEARGWIMTQDEYLAAGPEQKQGGWTAADFADATGNSKVAAILRRAAKAKT